MAPGDTYLHLPSNIYGFESWDEPLLTLWAERVVDPGRVPRLLSELHLMASDQVTTTLKRAAHLWLQSEDPAVELFLGNEKTVEKLGIWCDFQGSRIFFGDLSNLSPITGSPINGMGIWMGFSSLWSSNIWHDGLPEKSPLGIQ